MIRTKMFTLKLTTGLAVMALLTAGSSVQAHTEKCPPGNCVLEPIFEDAFIYVPPPEGIFSKKHTTNIVVSYESDFPTSARLAFDYAAAIWEGLINSSVTINIQANWTPLSSNVLGAAGPALIFANFTNTPRQNVWYPGPLAERISGLDLSPQDVPHDIEANFNSNFTSFYFGTDGSTPAGRFDFVTVVLHELGHGLGFIGSMLIDNSVGSWGVAPGGQGNPLPYVYDEHIENGGGSNLILSYQNFSASLAQQLTGGDLFFDGTAARGANGGIAARIYAPGTWNTGSSYAHLDASTFPSGNPNALMKPSISQAEAIHSPGEVTLGIFEDMGWSVADSLPDPPDPTVPIAFDIESIGPNPFPSPTNSSMVIRYSLDQTYDVNISIFNVLGERIRNLFNANQERGETYQVTWDGRNDLDRDVSSGIYIVRLRAGIHTRDAKVALIR